MKQKRKDALKTFFFKSNFTLKKVAEKTKVGLFVYQRLLLPFFVGIFRIADYKIGKMITPGFKMELDNLLRQHMPELLSDRKKRKTVEKDIVKAYFSDGMRPMEYYLYRFQQQNYWERHEWLSDFELIEKLKSMVSEEAFNDTRNKARFYSIMKKYFHREVCIVSSAKPTEEFISFATRQKKFIVKPIEGTTGTGTFITSVQNEEEAKTLHQQLTEKGIWMAEQLIHQHPETAKWNPSCVNTLRVPTFRTLNGCRILQPFFRTGRKGSVVDNAGQGGVFAVFDPETGIITTDGVDEYGGRYEEHPDSHLKFKGWQIPQYEELKQMAADLIHSMPLKQKYVGFDFALTEDGWVLVEGNSLGQFVGQIAELKGVRTKFMEYLHEEG